ncbi:MAG: GltB/FmdC/FwdC-like GXGXG domain-containing protein [Thermoplasmatota archaeon]
MCGIFGVIRKPGAPLVAGAVAEEAMCAVRHRGAGLGAGFARAVARGWGAPIRLRAFVDEPERVGELREALAREGFVMHDPGTFHRLHSGTLPLWVVRARRGPAGIARAVDRVNARFLDEKGLRARVFVASRDLDVWKDVAHADEVAGTHHIARKAGDAWIAHTREPTNSPGRFPIWSHPFATGDVAIVHNGDISSFGANMRYLRRAGWRSFTGTDSEAIAVLLHHLMTERGLTAGEAAEALLSREPGVGLDGPFAVATTWTRSATTSSDRIARDDETFLMVLTDRQKLRPVVLGEDDVAYYAASEEIEIRRVSPNARVWTPEPGAAFLASTRRGLLDAGRVAPRPQTRAGSTSGAGERFVAMGATGETLAFEGPTGNCLANALDGASLVVRGNVADDAADAMRAGSVVVHGDARDVLSQAQQGGVVLVRGNAGNRVALQMREYGADIPALVIGGGVDDYFGEYMAGGVAVALNLVEGDRGLTTTGAPRAATGAFVGTGMVGGALYVRGEIADDDVGLAPDGADVAQYVDTLVLDGVLGDEEASFAKSERDPERLRALLPAAAHGLLRLVENKYTKRPVVARRTLTARDRERIGAALDAFFEAFDVAAEERDAVLASQFTVVSGRGGAADEAEEG